MPALGLGTWKSEPGEVGAAVEHALRSGYRHLDCAPIYGNEAEIGTSLDRIFRDQIVKREDLWVTSKLWNDKHLPADVRPALEKTLSDLRLDFLDLYLIHWPIALRPGTIFPEKGEDFLAPDEAPLEETWSALEQLVDDGLCRHLGVSNFSPGRMRRLSQSTRHPIEVNQVECHPLLRQPALLETCRELSVALTAYSPLGSPGHKKDDPVVIDLPEVREIASSHGAHPAQVVLAWALQRGTIAIPKSTNPAHLDSNLAAAELSLQPDEMARLDALDRGHRYIDGSVWTIEGSPYSLDWLWQG
jgi:alcohol dehydrogenase (NADP+)